MRLKLDFLIVCLILAILMFSAVSASDDVSDDNIGDAAQDIVSLDTDDQCSAGDDVVLKDASGTFADLDNDIRSQTGSYITINRNYTYASSDGSTYRGITIDRSNIVIDGKGNTLNGNNQSIFFIVSPSAKNVTIKNFNFVNGNNGRSYDRACIYWEGDEGLLFNSTFNGCYGTSNRLVNIKWIGNKGTLGNCSFINSDGRDVYHNCIVWNGNNSEIWGCKFINNTQNACWITIWGDNPSLHDINVKDNLFRYEVMGSNGTVYNCDFDNVTWGIGFVGDYPKIYNCNFKNHYGHYFDSQLTFWGFHGLMWNCSFINNKAHHGGAFCFVATNLTVWNCTFIGNGGGNTGGAISMDANRADNLTVYDCKFINNTAEYGGAIYSSMYRTTVYNCTFENNSAYRGGAICGNINVTVKDCNFTDNSASDYGGAVVIENNDLFASDSYGIISNCRFIGNKIEGTPQYTPEELKQYAIMFMEEIEEYLPEMEARMESLKENDPDHYQESEEYQELYAEYQYYSEVLEVYKSIDWDTYHFSGGGAIYIIGNNVTVESSIFDKNEAEFCRNILIEKLTVPKMVIYPKIVNNQFLDTIVSFDPYDIYYGDDEAINGTFDSGSNFNRTLTMKSDSESADLSVEESENFTSNFTKPAVGLHKLSITNVDEFGNVYTIINTLDKQFTVTGINKVNISVDNVTNPTHAVAIVTADVDGTYTIRISPVSSTGNGLLFASGSTFTVNVKNGQGSQDLGTLDAGKYTATASGEFDYYITEPGSTDFTVFENPNPDSNRTNPDDEPANENETSSNSTTSDDTETPAVDVIAGNNQTQAEQMDNAEAKTLPATGNPILVAILAIFISLTSFRRRKI